MIFDIFLILIVLWVGFRLFSTLGKNPIHLEMESTQKEPVAPILTMEKEIQVCLPSFTENEFLSGAEKAFEYIVKAFTSGSMEKATQLLEDGVLKSYEETLAQREQKNIVFQLLFFRHIHTKLVSFSKDTSKVFLTVRFRSEQTLALFDKNNNLLQGNPDQSEILEDEWIFACSFPTSKPLWKVHKICTS